MKLTNWSTHATFGGEPMVSRYTQQRIAASDHCVAIAKRCPHCFEVFLARPERPDCHCQCVPVDDVSIFRGQIARNYPGNLIGELLCGCFFSGETAYPCVDHAGEAFETSYGCDSEALVTRLVAEAAKPIADTVALLGRR